MNRNISLASRDPLPLDREDIYKGTVSYTQLSI